MVVKGFQVKPLAKRVFKEVMDDNVLSLAAGTAYYFFLSIFPILLFVTPLLSVVGDKREVLGFLFGRLGQTIPAEAFGAFRAVVEDVVFSPNAPGLMSIGALLALWAGSNIFNSLMDALNGAYNVKETRPWWKRKLIAIGMVIVAGIIMALATVILLGGEDVVAWVSNTLGLGDTTRWVWTVLQFPLAISALVALAWIVFRVLPNIKQNNWHVLVGAIATTFLWLGVTLAFRLYVQNFGNYNATYGTIGGVIVLLTWMYLSMLTVLIGGELASELHHGTGAVDPRRGATIGDRIVSAGGRPSTERITRVEPMAASGRE